MKSKTPLVSITLAVYNGAKFLEDTLLSVEKQTYPHIETIVVDDGSTDDSQSIVKRHPQVKYLYQNNQGTPNARNAGIQASLGELLVFLDQDDLLLPHAVERGVLHSLAHPECGFVFGRKRLIQSDGTSYNEDPIRPEVSDYESQLRGHALVPPSLALMPKSVFEQVGGFRSLFWPADDYELYLRIARKYPLFCHNEFIVEYRRHRANASCHSAKILKSIYAVLDSQAELVRTDPQLKGALACSKKHWERIFGPRLPEEVICHLIHREFLKAAQSVFCIFEYHPQGIFSFPKIIILKVWSLFRRTLFDRRKIKFDTIKN